MASRAAFLELQDWGGELGVCDNHQVTRKVREWGFSLKQPSREGLSAKCFRAGLPGQRHPLTSRYPALGPGHQCKSLCVQKVGRAPPLRLHSLSCPGVSLPTEQGSWAPCCPRAPCSRQQHHQGAPASAHPAPGEPCFKEAHTWKKGEERAGPLKA